MHSWITAHLASKASHFKCFANKLLTVLAASLNLICAPPQADTLTIGVRENWVSPDLQQAKQITSLAAATIGHNIRFEQYPSKRSLMLASQGKLDGEFYRHPLIEPLFPSLKRVKTALGSFDYYVWMYQDAPCIENTDELTQLKPVGQRGGIFFHQLIYPLSKGNYEEVETTAQALEMLQRGRADYTVMAHSVMQRFATLNEIPVKTCLDKPLFSMGFYLYLHESNQELIPALEQAMSQVMTDNSLLE